MTEIDPFFLLDFVDRIHAARSAERAIDELVHGVRSIVGGGRATVLLNDSAAEAESAARPAAVSRDVRRRPMGDAIALVAADGSEFGLLDVVADRRIAPAARAMIRRLAASASVAIDNLRAAERRQARADEAVRQADLLGLAGHLSRMGAWSVDLETQRVFWSEQICAIRELPPGSAPTVAEVTAGYLPESRNILADAYRRCAEDGTPYDLELELVTPSGRHVWVRSQGLADRDEAGRIVRIKGSFQDISAIKAAEREARVLADRLRTTLESITDAFFTLDREWRFTYVNAEAERVLARDRSALLGRNVWVEFPEAVGSPFQLEYERALAEKVRVAFEAFYPPLDTWFEVTAYPSEEGLAVYFRDVTETRRTGQALSESEDRFRRVAKATTDTIRDWDLKRDAVWWSDGLEVTFGHEATGVEPGFESWAARIHPEDYHRVVSGIHGVMDEGRESWEDSYRFLRGDGGYAEVVDRGFVIYDDGGTAVRMVGGVTDVTASRELERRLRQSQRLEAVGQLTGGVAHDFNNLLTVILGNAEVLIDAVEDRDDLRPIVEMIRSAAERGADLTSHLLAFARQQTLEPASVDVRRLVESLDSLLRRTLGEDVEVERTAVPDLWHARVDASQLEGSLLNLALNARDAMPGGGRLMIEMANATLDQAYADDNDEVVPGDYVLVTVSDTGAGMPPEVAARVFEPFFTTKEVGKGTGLGLSMVYGFIKQSGGHLRISSETGRGTAIGLYLPRAGEGEAEASVHAPDLEVHGGDERILLVEDDPLVRGHVESILKSLGYRLISVADGRAALSVLRDGAPVDLLFSDVVMPGGVNGWQLAEEARRLRPGLPVLFTSGYTEKVLDNHGRPPGELHLLDKPYRRRDLAAKLRQVLGDGGHARSNL